MRQRALHRPQMHYSTAYVHEHNTRASGTQAQECEVDHCAGPSLPALRGAGGVSSSLDELAMQLGGRAHLHFADDEQRVVAVARHELRDVQVRLPQARARVVPAHHLLLSYITAHMPHSASCS